MSDHIVIIGGGPAGTGAAFEAASLGAQVTLIERDELGGTCLNRGCIPTKTILRTATALRDIEHAHELAIHIDDDPSLDLEKLRERKVHIVEELRGQLASQCKRGRIEVLVGDATLNADRSITVSDSEHDPITLVPDALIIATGSVPIELPVVDHGLDQVWTSDEALELTEIPEQLIIMGGGVIGVELASAYAAFGSHVTIVELADHILPASDARVARTLSAALKDQGITILTKTSVSEITPLGDRLSVTLNNGTVGSVPSVTSGTKGTDPTVPLDADVLLSAVGRRPLLPEGFDTDIEWPYPVEVVGDAAGGIMLAHYAEAQGEHAARRLVSLLNADNTDNNIATELDPAYVPACVYTHPEVATIGLGADEAKKSDRQIASGIAKFSANGKALAENDSDGFVSIIADKNTGALLGAQIVGPHAVELIATIGAAMKANTTVDQLADMVFAHPTVSEVIKTAARLAAASCK
ncbi:MAG: dihydrolipoyl dehydrogenase [Coriobacteriia bacterium]|nr:dihydrolipoyl dehydrogenase [Coriobacteriia bacterium]